MRQNKSRRTCKMTGMTWLGRLNILNQMTGSIPADNIGTNESLRNIFVSLKNKIFGYNKHVFVVTKLYVLIRMRLEHK